MLRKSLSKWYATWYKLFGIFPSTSHTTMWSHMWSQFLHTCDDVWRFYVNCRTLAIAMNYESYLSNLILFLNTSAELVFTFSKSTINTVEQVRQYAQSNELRHQDNVIFHWSDVLLLPLNRLCTYVDFEQPNSSWGYCSYISWFS